MAEHTPTPWRLRTEGNIGSAIEAPSGKRYSELDDGYRIVCNYQECCASDLYAVLEANRKANGEFIVKAVNNHEALVKALKKLSLAYVSLMEIGRDRIVALGGSCDPVEVMEAGDPSLREIRDVLASVDVGGARE